MLCNRMVERLNDDGCAQGHPAEAITGRIPLDEGEPVPQLARYNLAALLIPPIWGPAHGQWAGVVFLPIWLFADSIVASASAGPIAAAVAVIVVLATAAFQVVFARRANGMAYRRIWESTTIEQFARVQRRWSYFAVPMGALMLGWAVWYRLVLAAAL